ncbi:MAG: DUF2255 family protein [Thermomicrobiales bacterium]
MPAWSPQDLTTIDTTDEVRLATLRRDGTLRTPVTIWAVVVGTEVFVRAVRGPESPWFRGTRSRHRGQLHVRSLSRDVAFEGVPDDLAPAIDTAYRQKYGGYATNIVDSTLTPQAREATLRLVPLEG